MSGPPHHSHSRQAPPGNPAWNHLQVPNFFPTRQPQHAHMSNEHHMLHQPTWHTPTTEPMKTIPHPHVFNLDQMLSERTYRAGGVDLTLTRNGSQNGDVPAAPISLSVRDTNKINSLPPGALGIPAVELTKSISPGLKSLSPGLKSSSPGLKSNSPGVIKPMSPALSTSPGFPDRQDSPKNTKKTKRMDSVLEKLNPFPDRMEIPERIQDICEKPLEKTSSNSVHDENSNSSGILNVPTPTNDDIVSPYSNEDSLDSNKSRRKRKPSKTVRLTKEPLREESQEEICRPVEEKPKEEDKPVKPVEEVPQDVVDGKEDDTKEEDISEPITKKPRRKTSSESETIEKIASMVQQVVQEKSMESQSSIPEETKEVPREDVVQVSSGVMTAAQRKATNFAEVENKLEEMFSGIEETPPKPDEGKINDFLSDSKEDFPNDLGTKKSKPNRRKGKPNPLESTPKKKPRKTSKSPKVNKKKETKKSINGKIEAMKDVYAYDSGSNASSIKSKGPFIHIEGNRDSPVSVSIINTPTEEDNERKPNKLKKFHDDSEYRHKVRSKGLHCSTLSNKYDAQTKDASWICVFCKRGPHATEINVVGPSIFNSQFFPPGDLFGPYIITNKSPEYERRLDDPYDKQFKSKKIARILDAVVPVAKGKKSKRKQSESDKTDFDSTNISLGITPMSEKTFEIWAHEDCVVWSPGVYLVGPKIVGLEEAVWTCCNVSCVKCGFKGANVCCLKRGCTNVMHFGCAVVSNWVLDNDNFKAFCVEHKPIR